VLDQDPEAVDLRLAREAGDFGDPTDPNVNEVPAPDPTSQPGYGNTDPVGDPDLAMLSSGPGYRDLHPTVSGDFGDPTDPNMNEVPGCEFPDMSTMTNTIDDGEYASFDSGGLDTVAGGYDSPFGVDGGESGVPVSHPGSDSGTVGFDDPDLGD
jgi:hypothetical protein